MNMPAPELSGVIADGWLVLPAATYARALEGCPAAALLAEAGRWWLLPLRAGAGGLQLKQRNAAGDRVIEAREFLRAQGIGDDAAPIALTLHFVAERGGYELVAADAAANSSNAAVALAAYMSDGPPPM
jgi:hypothetical protein